MKVALVHDYLVDAGGAERIAEVFHQLYPEAPLYTSIFDPKTTFDCFSEMDIHASFLQYIIKIGVIINGSCHYIPLLLENSTSQATM